MTVKVEDLPGAEPYLISKLKRAGIQSVLDLAVYIPHELALGGDYIEGNGIAADIETISELVMTAKKALVDSGILSNQRWFKKQLIQMPSIHLYDIFAAFGSPYGKGGVGLKKKLPLN